MVTLSERNDYFVGNKAEGEFENGCFKKTKHAKFCEKQTFLSAFLLVEAISFCGSRYMVWDIAPVKIIEQLVFWSSTPDHWAQY